MVVYSTYRSTLHSYMLKNKSAPIVRHLYTELYATV